MRGFRFAPCAFFSLALAGILSAQTPAKVDFAKDVLPILRQNCVPCHGPTQQTSGLRLDRKSVVIGRRGVVPGSSENSFLFHRISGNAYGMQMPPTGPLHAEQIEIIKSWIDQGADWPDSLANEMDLLPLNHQAVALVDALHNGDLQGFLKSVSENPQLLNARGPEGSTPFMYAVLYTGVPTLERLLKLGADVNKRNDANVTALMWAASDLDKIRLLVEYGADVNARSSDMRTALMIAARRPGNAACVKFLLDHDAKPNPNLHPAAESSPLIDAATAGDAASVELLLSRGAETKDAGEPAIEQAYAVRCAKCADLVFTKGGLSKQDYTIALANVAFLGDVNAVRQLLDRGADVNAVDPLGRTPLMYAAASDLLRLDVVQLLVERGANLDRKDAHTRSGDSGLTALDIAKLHGDTPIVAFLVKAGARSSNPEISVHSAKHENSIRSAIESSLPLIQRADANFIPKAACASCHNNSFAALAVSEARQRGIAVDEKTAAGQVKANVFGLLKLRDLLHQGFFVPVGDVFGPVLISDILLGLHAEHYPSDLNTDAAVMYLKSHQAPDGQWPYPAADSRPPICSNFITQTVVSMRALQLYAPKLDKVAYGHAIQLAAQWIAKAQSNSNEDRTYRLLGLEWAGTDKEATRKALRELLTKQRPDGGWGDLDTMESSAYATGESLYALQVAGLPPSDPAYRRAVKYLLDTQQEDGSWYVRTRAMAFQPFFDSGFPHGYDQFISAAATSWATLALAHTPEPNTTLASRGR